VSYNDITLAHCDAVGSRPTQHLKSQAWFWKREKRADGWHWIDPRGQDHADLARWK